MSIDWQNVTVLTVVAVAVGYLALGAWRTMARRKAAGCGSCGTCPAGAETLPVVGIRPLASGAKATHPVTHDPQAARSSSPGL